MKQIKGLLAVVGGSALIASCSLIGGNKNAKPNAINPGQMSTTTGLKYNDEEMGDKAWYDAIIYRMFDFKLENIFEANIAKLLKRYKKGKFSKDEALNRDLDTERKTLEEGAK